MQSYKGRINPAPADMWMLHRQLMAHVATIPSSSAATMINGSLSAVVFYSLLTWWQLVAGFAALTMLCVWRFMIAKSVAGKADISGAWSNISAQISVNAALLGGFWGLVSGTLAVIGTVEHQIFAAIIGAGMMSAGAMVYRTMKVPAYLYIICCVPGCLAGLLWQGHGAAYAAAGLLMSYCLVLFKNVHQNIERFVVSNNRERELAKSGDTIQLLLNDFTEQGSDWLFELGAGERIVNASQRFAIAACRQLETMDGKRFPSLFDAGPEKDQLEEHLSSGRAFRGHVVSLTIDGERHWWSISARPAQEQDVVYRGVVTDITVQRKAEERVSYMAHYDGLTNLPNRFLFSDTVYRTLSSSNKKAGLLYLDLDNFKSINDTLGHSVGDQLLQAVARRLENCISGAETIARLGGDEFAILVPGSRIDKIDEIAENIIVSLSEPFSLDDHDVVVGVSIGIAKAPDHANEVEGLVRCADLALYAAKSMGRNRAITFETVMDEAAQTRRMIELDLRSALGKQEMRLHYQPLINVESGETSGYEALIRWKHPERGIVMPATFIPVAEETGLIVQLGEWVIRQALSDMAEWPEHLTVSVNLSPAQMRSPGLISTVVNALAQTGVDPKRVCLEITESVLMQDSEANIETLHKLRGLGLQIALDDFGTGYSSLNYLRSFPFSKIKIDRCFISEIDSREDCQAIVRSVVGLANNLGMTTTAEGVETAEQLDQLRIEGCFEVQGYLYSHAVPVDELSDLRRPTKFPGEHLVQMEEQRRAREAEADAEAKKVASAERRTQERSTSNRKSG
jgi:diguanylate cyclase (GGDEF)-like protein